MNGIIKIARALNRFEKHWKNTKINWLDFVTELSKPTRTKETVGEFMNMSKAQQDRIKDIGGFVCGYLKNGKRNTESLQSRCVITLDADFAPVGFSDVVQSKYGDAEYCIYSTHKHTPDNPRLRLLMPLDKDVSAEEYEAIARKIAYDIGIEYFDDTTYQPQRLMYFPSVSKDGEYIFRHNEGRFIKADEILATYDDWHDMTAWYVSSRQGKILKKAEKKQENPREKKGLIGAFCRAYDVHDAIAKFLPDVYTKCGNDRYTYINGSTSGGVVIYHNGDFAYSNHSTDKASGVLCNAFDLVRIHKFIELDEDAKPDTPVNRLPSYLKMCEFIQSDETVQELMLEEKEKEISEDFKDIFDDEPKEKDNIEALKNLVRNNKTGCCEPTIANIIIILQGDKRYNGKIALDEFSGRIKWNRKRIWNDTDDSRLRCYLEEKYGITKRNAIDDGLRIAAEQNKYHPVREYFNKLKWDGVPRIDNFFIEFLGCKDNEYVRAVTATVFLSVVARIFCPGCKVDTMAILVGKQGLGKSSAIRKLMPNEEWFSDSLTNIQNKDAYEQLIEKCILEISELSALKKSELELTKQFISKQSDNYRKAYGHHAENVKRQCIFVGTTNTQFFLKDTTGNRRFYPLDCRKSHITKSIWKDFDSEYRNQLWAEAVERYSNDEAYYIKDEHILEMAAKEQDNHFDESPMQADIENYLDMPLPEDWDTYDLNQRRMFINGGDFGNKSEAKGTVKRTKVCIKEIWCEAFGEDIQKAIPRQMMNEISGVLTRLGWQRNSSTTRLKIYGIQKYYVNGK